MARPDRQPTPAATAAASTAPRGGTPGTRRTAYLLWGAAALDLLLGYLDLIRGGITIASHPEDPLKDRIGEKVIGLFFEDAGVAETFRTDRFDVDIADFAVHRQARWREALASTFDRPSLLPFLGHLDRIEVHYAASDGTPRGSNVVRPVYHVAWLAARLGMTVETPLRAGTKPWSGYDAMLRHGRRRVMISLRPVESTSPPGTTLIVELHARRGHSQLWVEVTAYAEGVNVQAVLDNEPMPERRFLAPRRREGELLAETIDGAGRDEVSADILRTTALLVEP